MSVVKSLADLVDKYAYYFQQAVGLMLHEMLRDPEHAIDSICAERARRVKTE